MSQTAASAPGSFDNSINVGSSPSSEERFAPFVSFILPQVVTEVDFLSLFWSLLRPLQQPVSFESVLLVLQDLLCLGLRLVSDLRYFPFLFLKSLATRSPFGTCQRLSANGPFLPSVGSWSFSFAWLYVAFGSKVFPFFVLHDSLATGSPFGTCQ